ncbi:hypothetical protein E2C01_042417 [Portunus trituberculatus]|uniref:Uncharacterized protein n=1 Tax=Portunus trituberculatus TaxID=210409 RepID=A0A5B7FT08_PORTR|nr:hypothetical protein [Portunus trituberculatus]
MRLQRNIVKLKGCLERNFVKLKDCLERNFVKLKGCLEPNFVKLKGCLERNFVKLKGCLQLTAPQQEGHKEPREVRETRHSCCHRRRCREPGWNSHLSGGEQPCTTDRAAFVNIAEFGRVFVCFRREDKPEQRSTRRACVRHLRDVTGASECQTLASWSAPGGFAVRSKGAQ